MTTLLLLLLLLLPQLSEVPQVTYTRNTTGVSERPYVLLSICVTLLVQSIPRLARNFDTFFLFQTVIYPNGRIYLVPGTTLDGNTKDRRDIYMNSKRSLHFRPQRYIKNIT